MPWRKVIASPDGLVTWFNPQRPGCSGEVELLAIPQALRSLVYERDEGRCQRCTRHCLSGIHSIQHRRPRQMGGDRNANTAANLVLLCGSGTTGCHGYAESHRTEALEQGWLVHRWDDPALIPAALVRMGHQRRSARASRYVDLCRRLSYAATSPRHPTDEAGSGHPHSLHSHFSSRSSWL